jgi:hypothetical protein
VSGLPGASGEGLGPGGPRCSDASRAGAEPMAGTAPRADVWVAVEHVPGWGDADLTRTAHGVRLLMARGPRTPPSAGDGGTGGVDAAGTRDAGGVRVWVGYATGTPTLRVGRLERPDEVAAWDLAEIAAGSLRTWGREDPDPLLLVCANGRRDRCCGHSGGRLADSLWRGPHADRVLTCTHLGGHRFAPTALLLPVGALHGRVDDRDAADLLSGAARGRMGAETLRGFSTLDPAAQVAEAHVRTVTGYDGLAPLLVELSPSEEPDRLRATVHGWDPDDAQRPLPVELVRTHAPTVLSCGRDPEPTAHWSPAP